MLKKPPPQNNATKPQMLSKIKPNKNKKIIKNQKPQSTQPPSQVQPLMKKLIMSMMVLESKKTKEKLLILPLMDLLTKLKK